MFAVNHCCELLCFSHFVSFYRVSTMSNASIHNYLFVDDFHSFTVVTCYQIHVIVMSLSC